MDLSRRFEVQLQAGAPALTAALAEFRALRSAQIALIQRFSEAAWDEAPEIAWGRA